MQDKTMESYFILISICIVWIAGCIIFFVKKKQPQPAAITSSEIKRTTVQQKERNFKISILMNEKDAAPAASILSDLIIKYSDLLNGTHLAYLASLTEGKKDVVLENGDRVGKKVDDETGDGIPKYEVDDDLVMMNEEEETLDEASSNDKIKIEQINSGLLD